MTALAEQTAGSLAEEVREANRLLKDGDIAGALTLLGPLTSDESVYLPARFLLAMAAWKMDQLDRAVALMRDCHEKWPMDGTIAEALASLYAQAGNLNESLFMGKLATGLGGMGELAELIPGGFPIFDQVFYNIRERPLLAQAKAGVANGDLSFAVEKARQHSALNPEDGDAHAFHAALLLRVGAASLAADILHEVEGVIVGNGDFPAPYASLYGQALSGVGEFADARKWHAKADALAPKDAAIAAAHLADALWLEEKPVRLIALGEDWVRRFCPAPRARKWRRPEPKLVIGYVVSAFADPLDIAAVAAVARTHDRKRVTVVGYGAGEQSWQANMPFGGAFDTWQDVSKLDPATLGRFFARDGLNVIVDAAGFATPGSVLALAQVQTAIRVAWLGNSVEIGQPVYDARIAPVSAEAKGEALWRIAGGYPVLHSSQQICERSSRAGVNFGADVRMPQLDSETVKLWSAVLEALPEARLLLRDNDMRPGANVERLIARFGKELAARIDIVDVDRSDEFYATVDVALLPRRAVSPRPAAESLRYGVPAVALAGGGSASPYADFLRDLGLGSALVAADHDDYLNIATGLAAVRGSRDRVTTAIQSALSAHSERDFAQAIEEHAFNALELAEGMSS